MWINLLKVLMMGSILTFKEIDSDEKYEVLRIIQIENLKGASSNGNKNLWMNRRNPVDYILIEMKIWVSRLIFWRKHSYLKFMKKCWICLKYQYKFNNSEDHKTFWSD